MQFAVNENKKRTWLHGWWHDWTQGKVAIVVAAIGAVVAVVGAVMLVPVLVAGPSGVEDNSIFLPLFMLLFGLGAAAIGGVPVWRHANKDVYLTSGEMAWIEDGILGLAYHRALDSDPAGLDISCALLGSCEWWYDRTRRQLVVWAREHGAVREHHYANGAAAQAVPFERMRAADFMRFYPFYDPDLVETLRGMGVPEVGEAEARKRTRTML